MSRKAALSVLQSWQTGDEFAADLIHAVAAKRDLEPRDRAATQRLVYAVIRHQRFLDDFIRELANGKPDNRTRRILQLGLAEALLLDSAPHALVNEWVNEGGRARGLINAILRRALREKDELLARAEELSPEIRWSVPDLLWKRWVRQHGEEAALQLAAWNQQPAPVYLRVNPSIGDAREEILQHPEVSETAHPDFVQLNRAIPREWLERGWVYATDPSTWEAPTLLQAQPGETVLDACAAPGGKTIALASAMEETGRLLAVDKIQSRLQRMEDNLFRQGIDWVETAQHDWLSGDPWPADLPEQFDRVLADVPCSNTGVIRRRIDVPSRLRKQDFRDLRETQRQMLGALAKRVKPGGLLVYSTCSIDLDENDALAAEFLEEDARFSLEETRRTLPWVDGVDGSFAVALRRKSGG